jgi:hypothetical protein
MVSQTTSMFSLTKDSGRLSDNPYNFVVSLSTEPSFVNV